MQKLGYLPDKSLPIKVSTRDLPPCRDAAVLLIDQLKQIYIDGELYIIDASLYYPKMLRKDFSVALNVQTSGPDPDPILDLFYGCGFSLNWDGYCDAGIDKTIDHQSMEGDAARRKQILWAIEQKLAEDVARPSLSMTMPRPAVSRADRGSTAVDPRRSSAARAPVSGRTSFGRL